MGVMLCVGIGVVVKIGCVLALALAMGRIEYGGGVVEVYCWCCCGWLVVVGC